MFSARWDFHLHSTHFLHYTVYFLHDIENLMFDMGEERGCIGSCWGHRREGDHWVDLGVDRWIILGWNSRRWDVGI